MIFITAFAEYVFDSFEVQAFDYLLKPLEPEVFLRTMNRLLDVLCCRQEKHLLIQRGNEIDVVLFEEIMYCEVIDWKVYLHLEDSRVLDYYDRLENLEKSLDRRFFRCHRSYLVNLQHLRNYKKGVAYLRDGESVPVSRLRENEFPGVVLQYMKEGRMEK